MADKRDYYEVLGLSKSAGDDEIKKAYRKLAKQYHPDLHPGDAEAEAHFKEVNEAYSVLSDPDKKSKYDAYGHAAFEQGGGGGFEGFGGFGGFGDFGGMGINFDDILGGMFGGGARRSSNKRRAMRGDDRETRLTLTLEEVAFGCKKQISYTRIVKCKTCSGTGAKDGAAPKTCTKCGGSGAVMGTRRTAFGTIQMQTECPECRGEGRIIDNPCSACQGSGTVTKKENIEVNVPAGVNDGQPLPVTGYGDCGRNGGPNGDLYITFRVQRHSVFTREGDNILCEIPISFAQAVLGAKIKVPTLKGELEYDIPEGTQTGTSFTVKEQGIPNLRTGKKGSLIFTVRVVVPKNLTEQQKELLRAFSDSLGDKTTTKNKSEDLADKVKKMFGKKDD